MPDPTNRPSWVLALSLAIITLIIGILVGQRWSGGSGSGGSGGGSGGGTTNPAPPPGPIIIVQPDPVDPNDPNSAYIKVNNAAPTPQVEASTSNRLNKKVFGTRFDFSGHVLPNGGTEVLADAAELTATYRHCSVKPDVQCNADADCTSSSAGTCMKTQLRVALDSSNPPQLLWYMKRGSDPEIQLAAYDYGDEKKWRAEFCGRLDGDVQVTGKLRSNPSTTVTGKVPSGQGISIQAQ